MSIQHGGPNKHPVKYSCICIVINGKHWPVKDVLRAYQTGICCFRASELWLCCPYTWL